MFLNIFKHLLPQAKAWNLTINKRLREFIDGLSQTGDSIATFFDSLWLELFPATTGELTAWEKQFGLRDTGLTTQERRDRLDAAWQALGGQSPRYIQDTLQANGFDVYVHEWWVPGTEPAPGVKACVAPRNPTLYLRRVTGPSAYIVECGELVAECGEVVAEAGNSVDPTGYPLVNKVFVSTPDLITLCGEAVAECGEAEALCGNYIVFTEALREYIIPDDSTKWPYFLYIGGAVFGELARVDPKRREEFEDLCLKICPAQNWIGVIVEYN